MLLFQGTVSHYSSKISANYPSSDHGHPRANRCRASYIQNLEYRGWRTSTCVRSSSIYQFVDKLSRKTCFTAPSGKQSVKCSVPKPELSHNKLLRIAVMVSGGGRSLQNVCEQISTGQIKGCQVSLVVASKPSVGAIARARHFHIPVRVVRQKDHDGSVEHFSDAISELFDEFEIDLVVMAGWMHFYRIPPRYEGKVINIHPSLIPSFCGKGYYGDRVHAAVIKFGVKISGCTVHMADNQYDHGPIIVQKAVPVYDTDSKDEIAGRVFEKEKEALPEAIQLFVDGRLSIENGIVRIADIRTQSDARGSIV